MDSRSCNQGRTDTTIAALDSDIIETHVLTKFDGPSLASVASTNNLLHTLCNKQSLWEHICNSTWNSIKHPLVQQTIASFPGGYRSFYSDSFPILRTNSSQGKGSLRGQVETSQLISAVDIHLGNNPVYSKVTVTNTNADSFPGSLFCVDLIDHKETVEIPLRYQGDEKMCMTMSKLEENLRLSWIVIDPTLKRAANVSSLRPISVGPHWDKSGIEVTYATIISGDCCGTDTTEFVECRIVALFKCEEGNNNIELKELGLCLVDMVKMRLSGEKSLRILQEAMESGHRRKENGQGKDIYAEHSNCTRQRFIFWVFFAISIITSVYLITGT